MADALKARVAALDAQRRAIEGELDTLAMQLGTAGMTGPLVDAEGFPRADVDVMAVRGARQAITMRRNDLKTAMGELAGALEALHALGPAAAAGSRAASGAAGARPTEGTHGLAPFAWVDDVTPGSPAHAAGVLVGDFIVVLGPLRGAPAALAQPGPSLADVAAIVRSCEEQPVVLVVRRREEGEGGAGAGGGDVTLRLVPRRWAGAGLLGCHVLPCGGEAVA